MKHNQVFGTTPLPIIDVLDELREALAANSSCVLIAPPGAGKTTVVPLALLDADWLGGTKILVVVPRRLAARSAAERMAELLDERVGATIGIRARLASKIGQATRIEVITEGVFTRMVIDDPELAGVGAVIFDEFHERSLEADFGLALCIDVQAALREDLKIIVMSATLDGDRISAALANAPVIESEGRAFPVQTHYVGSEQHERLEQRVCHAVLRALHNDQGSCLVFLPGQGEIRRTVDFLSQNLDDATVEILPLYGGLTLEAQRAAIQPCRNGKRKVVLATAIAETSITIDGVRIVVDSGFARVPRFDVGARLTRLETVRVSRASADQRRGRAGRTEPGVCYRLWNEPETQGLRPFEAPEIQSADLTDLVLGCAAWGVADPTKLQWIDPPPQGALAAASRNLVDLGALDTRSNITAHGQQLRALPLPPHLGEMLLSGTACGKAQRAAELCALLVERGVGGTSVDLEDRHKNFMNARDRRSIQLKELVQQWVRQASKLVSQEAIIDGRTQLSMAQLLASAYPDRIAKRRVQRGQFLLANGRIGQIDEAAPLSGTDFLVVAEMQGTAARARILSAAQLQPDELNAVASDRIEEVMEVSFDRQAKAVRADLVRRLGAIVLQRENRPVARDEATAAELARGMVEDLGFDVLPWSKAQLQLMARVAFLKSSDPENLSHWPDLSETALRGTHADWLAPFLLGKASVADVSANDLAAALESLIDWQQRQRVDQEAPTHFVAPTGHRHTIDYSSENAPEASLRVQELYGLKQHPVVAEGRLPLTLSLLSPAGRPIQVTRDLPGFWAGSWRDVKTEMKGRYPKHVWPDDPANAVPTTRAKPKLGKS